MRHNLNTARHSHKQDTTAKAVKFLKNNDMFTAQCLVKANTAHTYIHVPPIMSILKIQKITKTLIMAIPG